MPGPGLPAVGLAAMMFVAMALAMPLIEAYRALRGRGCPARRRLAMRQATMAVAILAALAITLWLLVEVMLGGAAVSAMAALMPLGALLATLALVLGGAWATYAVRR